MTSLGSRSHPLTAPAEVRAYAVALVAAAYTDREETTRLVGERWPDGDAAALVAEVWAARAAELARPATDEPSARLEAAFGDLEAAGLLSRADFACCQSCGHEQIQREPGADRARGYVFFHREDLTSIVDGTLRLAFGGLRPDPSIGRQLLLDATRPEDSARRRFAREEVLRLTDAAIGREVVSALSSRGFEVRWDGSHQTRIEVDVTGWRRPLPARASA